jgi:hypothetical protein
MVPETKVTIRCDFRPEVENKALVLSELSSGGLRVEDFGIRLASILGVV